MKMFYDDSLAGTLTNIYCHDSYFCQREYGTDKQCYILCTKIGRVPQKKQ